jgi:uncharacterized protein YecT (DUF1311 family)
MKRLLLGALAISLVTGAPVLRAQSQQEMNQTAEADFEKADAKLNSVYKKLLAKQDEEGRKKLIAAERAWVAYRDAEADFEADAAARGGSMEPMIYSGTAKRLTDARIKELAEALKDQ